tara:strand:- start:8271 stop:10025 length:1755 start_codon:yes stop_codon:yes gene_type:complete
MIITKYLTQKLLEYVSDKYSINDLKCEIIRTRKGFEGLYTIVLFSLIPKIKKSPQEISDEIVDFINTDNLIIESYNVIQGFLNLNFTSKYLINTIENIDIIAESTVSDELKIIEFCSPNTNKPLHLGHIRNILLGDSISKILNSYGYNIHKTQIINDRGIHICKSMIAWMKFGNNGDPVKNKTKGDHYVGEFYVKFNHEYEKQVRELVKNGKDKKYSKENAKILKDAKNLLIKWEKKDDEVTKIWKKMNSWVIRGFNETLKKLDIVFDSEYFESETYLIGKEIVEKGLKSGLFYKKQDNSVWVDLTDEGLDEKILIRSDGTSVYMTQDLGTAYLRYQKNPKLSGMIYTTGNEQDYHFKVLFKILEKLKYNWASKLQHLSYGMVDLPSGKMKSREGTVVDADDLISSMISKAKIISDSMGKINDLDDLEKNRLYKTIALGALKYHILKVDPKKKILFNPDESIDFNGNTGPFIQYTYARIKSILFKNNHTANEFTELKLVKKEKDLIILLCEFRNILNNSVKTLNPSLIANHVYELAKLYNSYYQTHTILGEKKINSLRVFLSKKVAMQIEKSMGLLGISVPDRM